MKKGAQKTEESEGKKLSPEAYIKKALAGRFKHVRDDETVDKHFEIQVWVPVDDGGPIDLALGGKGVPGGRIILLSSEASRGKTLIGIEIMAAFQRVGGMAHLIEPEGTFIKSWAQQVGLNMKNPGVGQDKKGKLHNFHPLIPFESAQKDGIDKLTVEACFEYIERMIKFHRIYEKDRPVVFLVDSISALVPQKVLEQGYVDLPKNMGLKARAMSAGLAKISMAVRRSNCTIIFISQLRDKIAEAGFMVVGDKQTTDGGNAPKFYNSIHLELTKDKDGDLYPYSDAKKSDRVHEPVGERMRMRVRKTKIGVPHRHAFPVVYYEADKALGIYKSGIDYDESKLGWLKDRSLAVKYAGTEDKKKLKKHHQITLLDGTTHVFLGVSGWKAFLAQEGMAKAVKKLMKANIKTRGTREQMEKQEEKRDKDYEGDELDAPEAPGELFEEESEDAPKPQKSKGKKGKKTVDDELEAVNNMDADELVELE